MLTIDDNLMDVKLKVVTESNIGIFPHDALIKLALTPANSIKGFFENYIPSSIGRLLDTNSIRLEDPKIINYLLQEKRGDLKFYASILGAPSYPGADIFIEHFSTKQDKVILRFLEFAYSEILKLNANKDLSLTLPYIKAPICIVIYSGADVWDNIADLRELSGPRDSPLGKYYLNFKAHLINLSKIPFVKLGGPSLLRASMTALKYGSEMRPENFYAIMKMIYKAKGQDGFWEHFFALGSYALAVVPIENSPIKMVKEVYKRFVGEKKGEIMGEMIAKEIYGPLKAEGKAEDLILILTNRFGENRLSAPLTQAILNCTDSEKLTAWIKVALNKKTTWAEIEKFQKFLNIMVL